MHELLLLLIAKYDDAAYNLYIKNDYSTILRFAWS